LHITFCAHAQDAPHITYGHQSFELEVQVVNRTSLRSLDNVLVSLYELPEYQLVTAAYTNQGGIASFFVDPKKEYTVETCKRKFLSGGVNFFNCHEGVNVFCINGTKHFDFSTGGGYSKPYAMLKTQIAIDSISVGKTFKLENVYYDLGKWYLRSSSKRELNKLYRILNEYPSMIVELSSHTDSRGTEEDNSVLSGKRAQSCYDYLIDKGIESYRINPSGYGESKPVNDCVDGVGCTEDQHQKNRRTEFTIMSFAGQECATNTISPNKPED